jgi:hypothetical protein
MKSTGDDARLYATGSLKIENEIAQDRAPHALSPSPKGMRVKRGRERPRLMQAEFAVDRLEFGRLDQLAVRDLHGVQRALELLLPKLEEPL